MARRHDYAVSGHGLGSLQISSGPVQISVNGETVNGHFEGEPGHEYSSGCDIIRTGTFNGQPATLRIRPSGVAWLQLEKH